MKLWLPAAQARSYSKIVHSGITAAIVALSGREHLTFVRKVKKGFLFPCWYSQHSNTLLLVWSILYSSELGLVDPNG